MGNKEIEDERRREGGKEGESERKREREVLKEKGHTRKITLTSSVCTCAHALNVFTPRM